MIPGSSEQIHCVIPLLEPPLLSSYLSQLFKIYTSILKWNKMKVSNLCVSLAHNFQQGSVGNYRTVDGNETKKVTFEFFFFAAD